MRGPIALYLLLLFAKQAPSQTAYQVVPLTNGGSVLGTVRLARPETGDRLDMTKDEAVCGRMKPSPSLVVGKQNGVKDAVVLIEGITHGKRWETVQPVLDQRACEYVPHVLVVPVGTQLEIVNSDPILHNVHAYDVGPELRTIFNIAQPIKGQRTSIRQTRMTKPGVVLAVCDAGHPWMTAYVVVAPNPYYAVTDHEGNFRIEEVPPGSYKVRMWHEGVKIVRREFERGIVKKYHFEDPYEVVKDVSVQGGIPSHVDFELVLR